MNALILRPVNVPEAQSLFMIERGSDKNSNQSYPDYLDSAIATVALMLWQLVTSIW